MKSKSYWAKRKRERMDEYHKDNDRVIGKVLEAYQDSINDINEQMRSILKTFTAANKITLEESKDYLTIPQSKDFINNLKQTIDGVQDEELRAEMLRQINAPAYRARLTRLQAMKEKLNVECKSLADIQVREIEKGLINTANTSYYKTIFDIQQMTGIGFSFAEIPSKQVEEILKNNWSGKHFSKRIWKNTDVLASELEHTITKGFMVGSSVQKMSKEIADKMQVGEFAATRLIRTETTYVANAAELEAYKECDVDKIMFLATLDLRTSNICREHDEDIISLDKAILGENVPPLHPNCRSTTLEVFEDDDLSKLQRRARDPNTGVNTKVPANMKYKDWYKENVANNPRATAEERKIKNKASDKKQYGKYKKVLGKDAPKSFDMFQELKYNNVDEWEKIEIRYGIKTGKYNLTLNKQAYEKHLEGHKRFNDYVDRLKEKGSLHMPSSLTISYDEAQKLIKQYAGKGIILVTRGQIKELIQNNDKIVGVYRDIPNKIEEKTTKFIIHYSKSGKKGCHIVPMKE